MPVTSTIPTSVLERTDGHRGGAGRTHRHRRGASVLRAAPPHVRTPVPSAGTVSRAVGTTVTPPPIRRGTGSLGSVADNERTESKGPPMETTRETENLASIHSAGHRMRTEDHASGLGQLPVHGPTGTGDWISDAYRQALITLDDFEKRIVGVSRADWEADFAGTHGSLVAAACQAYASAVCERLE
jgi:hypothetical protein